MNALWDKIQISEEYVNICESDAFVIYINIYVTVIARIRVITIALELAIVLTCFQVDFDES